MLEVFAGGEVRKLANIAAPLRLQWRLYGDADKEEVIPRSQWKALIDALGVGPESPFLPPVHDQNGIGQCNADATTAAMEYARAVQGLPYVQLSAADLYHQINGGADNGSMLEDGLKASMHSGVGTAADCGETIWRRGYKPASSQQRRRFRVLEAVLCPTFDHCVSAALRGWGLISGIMWHQNYEPGQDGWLPLSGQGQGGGHAVFGYKPTYRGSHFGIWHQNSWGQKWGMRGLCVFPESAYVGPVGGWWAVRQVVTEEHDTPAPDFSGS